MIETNIMPLNYMEVSTKSFLMKNHFNRWRKRDIIEIIQNQMASDIAYQIMEEIKRPKLHEDNHINFTIEEDRDNEGYEVRMSIKLLGIYEEERMKHTYRGLTLGEPFGRLLKKKREFKGMNQRELGRKAGVTGQYISYLERNKGANPTIGMLRALAKALEIDVGSLI